MIEWFVKNMNISEVKSERDLNSIRDLHINNLPSSICDLTALGDKVVIKFYYEVLKEKLGYVIKAYDEEVRGFCLITIDSQKMFNCALARDFKNIIQTFMFSEKKGFVKVMLKKLLYNSFTTDDLPQLIYIAVDKQYSGKGIGYEMLMYAENIFRELGVKKYSLDVEKNNVYAIKFYMKNKFKVNREYKLGSSKKLLLVKELT